MTRKLVTKAALAVAVLGAMTLGRPAPADAHFSLFIGLPGFAFFTPAPPPPPVVYAPPTPYYYPGYYYAAPARFVVHHDRFGHRFEGWGHHHHD